MSFKDHLKNILNPQSAPTELKSSDSTRENLTDMIENSALSESTTADRNHTKTGKTGISESSNESIEEILCDLPEDKIENVLTDLSGQELESIFRDLHHPTRVACVLPRSRILPREQWWDLDRFITNNSSANDRWGVGEQLVECKEGLPICSEDNEAATARKPKQRFEESVKSDQSESIDESINAGVSAGPSFGGKVSESETKSESESKTIDTNPNPKIFECNTYAADCRLNRRAFWKLGNYHFVTGSSNRSYLRDEIARVLREKDSNTEPDADDNSTCSTD